MHDQGYLDTSLNQGQFFYKAPTTIYADLTGNCYIRKCYDSSCKSESAQLCQEEISDQQFFPVLTLISKEEFESTWRNAPIFAPATESYKCPYCNQP